jgi:uncharacterized membrane protein YkvA (DUF1232 family)
MKFGGFSFGSYERDREAVRDGFWRKARRNAAGLPFAEELVAAYYCAFDRDTPLHVKATLVAALAYFLFPADTIPDVIPVLGFTDDAAVLTTAVKLIADQINALHYQAARDALARL